MTRLKCIFFFAVREVVGRWMGSVSGHTRQADMGSMGLMDKERGPQHNQEGLLQQCGQALPPLQQRSSHSLQDSHRSHGPPPQVLGSQKTTMECLGVSRRTNRTLSELRFWGMCRSSSLNTSLQCRTKYCELSTGRVLWLRACQMVLGGTEIY